MGSSDDWKDVIGGLGDHVHSVAVDLPGHGRSLGLPEEAYATDGAANALLRTLDDLGVRRASLVGYSMGGRLALYFALRHPERCDFGDFLEAWHRQPLFATLEEGMVESLVEKRERNDPHELAKSLRGMGTGSQPSLWEELKTLHTPTLAVAGELDGKFAGMAREMAERSPRISIEIVSGAGHNVRVEAPGEYSKLFGEFLEAGKLK
jgi:pimeloyl-ACP methyl ester carboxylesterase